MNPSTGITPDLLASFMDEAPEYLEMLDEGLMDFESKAGSGVLSLDSPEDQEQMNTMFRAAHSLKGLAAAFGFEDIKELTHRMETLFDQVRMRKRDLTAESFDTLFKVFDKLKELVAVLSDDSLGPVEIEDIVKALDAFLESDPLVAPVASSKPPNEEEAEAQEESVPRPQPPGRNEVFDDPELAALFVETVSEAADQLSQGLLSLEDDPQDMELLNRIFRCAHNIKGASGAAGMPGLNKITHDVETVFDRLRNGRGQIEESLMTALLGAVDLMRGVIDEIRSGNQTDLVVEEVDGLFADWLNSNAPAESSPPADDSSTVEKSSDPLPPPTEPTDSEYDGGDDGSTLTVTVTFADGFEEAPIQAYLISNKLNDLGNVISTTPDLDDVSADCSLTKIVFQMSGHDSPNEVKAIIETFNVQSVSVTTRTAVPTEAEMTMEASPTRESGSESVTPAPAVVQADAGSSKSAEAQPASKKPVGSAAGSKGTSTTESKTAAKAQKGPKVGETLRVDQERLDQLMNLGGELVINRARFAKIHGDFRSVFDGKNLGFLVDDMTDRFAQLSEQVDRLDTRRDDRQSHDFAHHLLHLQDGFKVMRSLVQQVHDLRSSMYDFDEALHGLNRVSDGIQRGIMGMRMVPIGPLFSRFKRVVRDVAKSSGKKIQLILRGDNTELDKRMIDELGDPLTHMVRNSVDHGLEMPDARASAGKDVTGSLILEACHRGNSICIEVSDDGAGVNLERVREKILEKELATPAQVEQMSDKEIVQYIFQPGFSTAAKVTDISGRGMGMDIVVSKIEGLSGTIEIDSVPGKGTKVTIKLPLTLAIMTSMVARINKDVYAIPLENVAEIITAKREDLQYINRRCVVRVRDLVVPVATLEEVFDTSLPALQTVSRESEDVTIVIIGVDNEKMGLVVDGLLGQEDVVIKSIAENYQNVRGIAGASIRGDGTVSLILDVVAMLDMSSKREMPAPKVAQPVG